MIPNHLSSISHSQNQSAKVPCYTYRFGVDNVVHEPSALRRSNTINITRQKIEQCEKQRELKSCLDHEVYY